ncbi:hypothetical protein [Desertivirga brevis]|uniref:hypothetical protein n=1 Tax=Desertivirga brevis TaxID=2810310 RepID=UPI001A977B7A|nr:hypothetical protein [Pedobacter sp. SYSU D00873]
MITRKKVLTGIGAAIFLLLAISFLLEDRTIKKTKHFSFIYSSSIDSQKIIDISTDLEESYLTIAQNLKTKPSTHIETHIYARKWDYIKATKHLGASGNILGPSEIHFIVRSLEESKKVAVHEFTHTVVLQLLINREPQPFDSNKFDQKFASFPVWLWESVSVYEAKEFIDPKQLEDLREGRYPSIKELNTRSKGQKIYTYGYTLIDFILEKYKRDKLIELIENYGDLEKTLGITEEQFSKEWYMFVREKYLK